MECIDACAALDASDPARADAGAGAMLDADAGAIDGAGPCPEPPFPCERLCWELDARFGRGRPTTLTSIDVTNNADLAAIGEPYMQCAQAKAAECRVAAVAAPDAGTAVAPSLSELPVSFSRSWTGLFLECAGLPPDFDAFD